LIARRFEPKDFDQVNAWAKEWGSSYEPDQLPAIGYIVDGIAAYFLYQTDSKCCWLENLIAKKDIEYHVRDKALSLIIDEILDEAKRLGFKVAYASTSRYQVALRAKKYGAMVEPNHMLLTLKLND
jgi:hypothetical protein